LCGIYTSHRVSFYFNLSIVAATAFAEFAKMVNRWRLSRSCAPRVLDGAVDPRGRQVSQDSQALKERASAVQSELNELRVASDQTDANKNYRNKLSLSFAPAPLQFRYSGLLWDSCSAVQHSHL